MVLVNVCYWDFKLEADEEELRKIVPRRGYILSDCIINVQDYFELCTFTGINISPGENH